MGILELGFSGRMFFLAKPARIGEEMLDLPTYSVAVEFRRCTVSIFP